MKRLFLIIFTLLSISISAQDIGGDYYVSTTGSDLAAGTYAAPFASLQQAISVAEAGDSVIIRGGTYYPDEGINYDPLAYIPIGHTGTQANPIVYMNYPGEHPILDFRNVFPPGGISTFYHTGISLSGIQYVKFKGIEIRNVWQRPYTGQYVACQGLATAYSANLTFEQMTIHDISGRAFSHMSGAWNEWDGAGALWDYDTTRFINCDAYNLCDTTNYFIYPTGYEPLYQEGDTAWRPGNSADGFKTHCYNGIGVLIWDGCRAWNYSDDGIDPSGEGYKYISNTWVMSSRKYYNICHRPDNDMEGNGIKNFAPRRINGEDTLYRPELLTDTILVTYRNNIAAYCDGAGFYNNLGYSGTIYWSNNALVYNNISYRNYCGFQDDGAISRLRTPVFRNNIALYSTSIYQVAIYRPSIYTHSNNSWIGSNTLDDWPGWEDNTDYTVTDADFTDIDSLEVVAQITAARKTDGSLPDMTVFRLAAGSDLIGAGVNVGMSATPDIGIDWEYLDNGQTPLIRRRISTGKNGSFSISKNRHILYNY